MRRPSGHGRGASSQPARHPCSSAPHPEAPAPSAVEAGLLGRAGQLGNPKLDETLNVIVNISTHRGHGDGLGKRPIGPRGGDRHSERDTGQCQQRGQEGSIDGPVIRQPVLDPQPTRTVL
jgi:hypothetical protein